MMTRTMAVLVFMSHFLLQILLAAQIFLFLQSTHPRTELVLSKDPVDSRFVYLHSISLPKLGVRGVVPCQLLKFFSPLFLWGRTRGRTLWRGSWRTSLIFRDSRFRIFYFLWLTFLNWSSTLLCNCRYHNPRTLFLDLFLYPLFLFPINFFLLQFNFWRLLSDFLNWRLERCILFDLLLAFSKRINDVRHV